MLLGNIAVIKLIVLLCAGAFVYNLGHGAALASAKGSDASSGWEAVAASSVRWIAHEVHQQTAWSEESASQPSATEASERRTYAKASHHLKFSVEPSYSSDQ